MTIQMRLLGKEEKERIHGRAQDLLQEAGIRFGTTQALEIQADPPGPAADVEDTPAPVWAHEAAEQLGCRMRRNATAVVGETVVNVGTCVQKLPPEDVRLRHSLSHFFEAFLQ